MAHVFCDECLRTYEPYTYRESLRRAVVSGVGEWHDVEDYLDIHTRYQKYIEERGFTYGGRPYLNQRGYISCLYKIRKLFPSVDDFNVYHGNFNKQRLTKISARFLCFDCEEYLCAKCIRSKNHSEHFTFSEDDKNNMNKWDKIETKIMQAFIAEGETKEEYIKQERAVLCNVVDVRDLVTEQTWEKFLLSEKDNVYDLGSELDRDYVVWNTSICISNDNQTFLVINNWSTRMKIYNIGSYELIDTIELPYRPAGITEIPSTDPSQSLIAVSFDNKRQINIMNIRLRPADVIYSFNVQGRCNDLAYCNNKLIARCEYYQEGKWRHSIHVMDISGEIINIIDIHKDWWLNDGSSICVHSESETIYVRHYYDSVTCLSVTGQVIHATRFTDLVPRNICVDRDRNVYVMDDSLPLYKLSSDLSERVKIVDEDAANVDNVTSIEYHKNKIYMADMEVVYIFSVD